MSRRRAMGLAAAGVGVAAVAVSTTGEPAGATTGAMQYGTSNAAGTDSTALNASNSSEVLYLTNLGDGAGLRMLTHPAAPNPGLGVYSQGSGMAVRVFTYSNTSGGGIAVEITNPSTAAPGLKIEHAGNGNGIRVDLNKAAGNATGIYSVVAGKGRAVYGRVNNANASVSAVYGRNSGTGAGVEGWSSRGPGGVFAGATAQARLVASSRSTHPATGTRGDLFVDRSGRLWFCKGGSTWSQLA